MSDKDKYIEAIGRRKTAVARVRITPSSKTSITVNNDKLENYFSTDVQISTVKDPLEAVKGSSYNITVKVSGGGLPAQAEAVRLGMSRALIKEDDSRRKDLKALGYLKRDPRKKERKKFGLKGARRAPQWSKR